MANNKPFVVKSGLIPQTHNNQDLGHTNNKFANAHISNLAGAVQINSAFTLPTTDGSTGNQQAAIFGLTVALVQSCLYGQALNGSVLQVETRLHLPLRNMLVTTVPWRSIRGLAATFVHLFT